MFQSLQSSTTTLQRAVVAPTFSKVPPTTVSTTGPVIDVPRWTVAELETSVPSQVRAGIGFVTVMVSVAFALTLQAMPAVSRSPAAAVQVPPVAETYTAPASTTNTGTATSAVLATSIVHWSGVAETVLVISRQATVGCAVSLYCAVSDVLPIDAVFCTDVLLHWPGFDG